MPLNFVAIDFETANGSPASPCAVGLVRVRDGQIAESIATLIQPPYPNNWFHEGNIRVHGIRPRDVDGAPELHEALAFILDFVGDDPLVAHNAPFDMEFLRRVEGQLGVSFDMPVLDTVLLSAVVYGQHEVHSLDALSHRLGITIPEEARHTALGDTLATADAFLKLVPMLAGRGLETFGSVLTEVRKHGRLLKDLN